VDGEPIKAEISAVNKLDASQMTPDQRDALREIIRQQAQMQLASSVESDEDEDEVDEDEADDDEAEIKTGI
jgi:hypothetical protein